MGLTYGPLGTALGAVSHPRALYRQLADVQSRRDLRRLPRAVHRHLARATYGLQYVGYYLAAASLLTVAGIVAIRETKDESL